MDLTLAYQTAVVIGGAKGIGRAIAEAFAEERTNVVLADVDPAVNQTAAELAAKHDAKVVAHEVDVTDYLAVFLASYRANNITGQTMNVDGGQVMH